MGGATIYILRGSDGSYYTGITRRPVEERVSEHVLGLHEGYTFTRGDYGDYGDYAAEITVTDYG